MPAVSQKQQKFMGMVHADQEGKLKHPSAAVSKAAGSMSHKAAKDFASTSREGLPEGENEQTNFGEVISRYNEYGNRLRSELTMMELAEELNQIAEFAEQTVMSEADDWFDGSTIKRNMKEIKGYVKEFAKVAQEYDTMRQRATALYDDMGHVLGRYFEIRDNGTPAMHHDEFDTGEDIISADNTGKDQVDPQHDSQKERGMSYQEEDDGQLSNMMGFMPNNDATAQDDGTDANMDDIREFDNDYPDERDGSEMEIHATESGERFKHLTHQLSGKGAHDPKALAAWIGRKKYGAKKMGQMAHHEDTEIAEAEAKQARHAKNKELAERIVTLARHQLKGENLIKFDTLKKETQIRAAWRLIR